jgi:hypothetical protein
MKKHGRKLSPEDPLIRERRIRQLTEFWNCLRVEGDSGATTWEVLERLERSVTDSLYRLPPDLDAAESATAQAMFIMAGGYDDL